MKVYVVTTGEYSDYTIKGVFSTYEAASAAVAAINKYPSVYNENNGIEEYELDGYQPFEKYLTLYYNPCADTIDSVMYNEYVQEERVKFITKEKIFMVIHYSPRFTNKDVLLKAVQDRYMKWKAEQNEF